MLGAKRGSSATMKAGDRDAETAMDVQDRLYKFHGEKDG